MKTSVLSRIVVAGVAGAATLGWVGAQQAMPLETVHAAPAPMVAKGTTGAPSQQIVPVSTSSEAVTPGVRNRASWQPSPIPSQYSQISVQASASVDAVSEPKSPAVMGLELSQTLISVPSPVAVTASPSLFTQVTDWLKQLLGRTGAPETVVGSALPLPGPVVRLDEAFSHDTLEQLFNGGVPEQRGEWRYMTFFSRSLAKEVTYLAWVPPGYGSSNQSYPSLYLLHGVGGEAGFGVEEWLGYALTEDLERMLALGLIEPMIVILPQGDQSYWMNHADGGPKWGDFVAVDLVKHVDATFRTIPSRERRAIGGLSMGGHGALQLALNHPDTFAIAGAHSPTIRPFEESPEFFGDQQWFAKHDPLSLVQATNAASRLLTWIDIGEEDRWLPGTLALRDALAAKRATLEFRVMEGEHEGWYWQYYLPEYLSFYSKALHATATTPQGAPKVAVQMIGASVEFSSIQHS
ncbi:MAG TPA: alpha/beta hydrolase-fold protein [Chloroflexota bacterium]|nr:alpha/beta hydrolase-fold protein [Chloroflexota bacterium]